ncbi:response regulator [Methyloversatilis sp.]|uniref:response regulator n=1 Tax=Methyloversatilis sp. TaxID=2569862 RepID=UPI00273459EA|nr:response regulator [Methyloversatilis sp.]MDP2867761.1 response regulator [Methyloversatilis sp.]MDP3288011.1 response regulator [Methyloversatilis sp.]MDP3455474.1 response regulator [Methyloversatilis sp.]MDP3577637.1 response regulator [Methyloversatilis sp.]
MSLHLRDILVVEDNDNDVELMLLSLGELKLANDIIIARDGVDGLDYLYRRGRFAAREGDHPLFMLLDLNMPRMGGIDMLVEMRRDDRLRSLPVVIMTSSREDPDLRRCYDLGINAYVVKPVDFDQFSRTVTNLGIFWALINEPPPRI